MTSGVDLPVAADRSLRRLAPRLWVGGSPLKLFRLGARGEAFMADLLRRAPEGVDPDTVAERRLLNRLVAAGAANPVPRTGSGPPASSVAVVVPVRDDPGGLACLLEGLAGSGVGELVVVDDCSRDPAAVRAVAGDHGARVIRHRSVLGPGAARNTGAGATDAPVIAFVDADVVPGGHWLEVLLAHLARERVAMVAPRVRSSEGPGLLARYERQRSPLDLGPDPARVAQGTRVAYVPSAAILVRRSAFDELGGFDEALRRGEDVDLVWRAVESGREVRYEPAAIVGHRPRSGWTAWALQRAGYGASAPELDLRHPGAVAPAVLSGWSLAVWALVCLGRPVLAGTVAGGTGVALAIRLPDVPRAEAAGFVLRGHLLAGTQLAQAATRTWWPLLAAGSVVSRRVRRLTALALAARVAGVPGPASTRALAVLDDLSYGAGVWWAAGRVRSVRSLLPRLLRWP